MNPAFAALKRRVSLETDFNLCIICQKHSDDDLNNLTRRGINTFVNALQLRYDDVYNRLQDSIKDIDAFLAKSPKCHRKCRSRYTHKRDLETKQLKSSLDLENQDANATGKRSRTSPVDFKSCCFICNKQRDRKGERRLILVATKQ